MSKIDITNTQTWFREYSCKLASSFRASASLRHNPTKGDEREFQIFDTLSLILPQKVSISKNVVICDSTDAQSPKFDGALIDRDLWPCLFNMNNTICVMIESVRAAIEVKSSLDKGELDKVFSNSAKLRQMKSAVMLPFVTAFSYECDNPNLSFFDFSASFLSSKKLSPSLICILNQNLFGFARLEPDKVIPINDPQLPAVPVIYYSREDTLLLYLYFLTEWMTAETQAAESFKLYSNSIFHKMDCFHFDADFLSIIKSDRAALNKARKCFERKPTKDITELYAEARKQLKLSVLSE